ncbi:uncharacterized protein K460DRAFT_364330 [Cucurbitaria berberidis CBS 394.84]|uniref:Uncharacterized protein n=1 Tax=Cucurbitaria berberidis CBS 394.84 TaxID=1168544 RepID=A0A9P4GNC1_9PLEO|nr:uncharacterized protein K460DRAFT_364330 [Cucurbitaria berberidis CBS 394.84]KAF1848352.1 hypothetical protein K460DRAFT_364330 [Cucurbitaria berberidis CBS 394.84]
MARLFLTIIASANLGSSFPLLNSCRLLLVANHLLIRNKLGFESVPLDDVHLTLDDEVALNNQDLLEGSLATNALLNHLPAPEIPIP